MRILVACEESQAVCIELRRLGHEAYSCDIGECSGGHPEWHIKGDVLPLINGFCQFDTMDGTHHIVNQRWDMLFAFPPCTYLTNAGSVRMRVNGVIQQDRLEKAMQGREFFMKFFNADCDRIIIENPTPMKIVQLPPYSQAIQPYHHGHPYSKRTCLWLKGVDPLKPTCIMDHHEPYVNGGHKDHNGNYRRFRGRKERDQKTRSKTFPGIAKAMAEQWAGENKQEEL